jgi:voltage-dependent anion channel protein 2
MILMRWSRAGLTLTQTWNTANTLETKIEMADNLAKGLKAEGIFSFLPATQKYGTKFNLHFQQSNFHGRAFFDLLKGPTASIDAIVGRDGFLAGASAGYDVAKAKITGYSAAIGYQAPTYSAAITATDNLSVFSASYYHKVNSQVEAGSKATWNSKSGNAVGLEVAAKYRLDPVSFVKVSESEKGPWWVGNRSADYATGQDQRPRCCRRRLQRAPPRGRHPRRWCFVRYPEARPGHPQGMAVLLTVDLA